MTKSRKQYWICLDNLPGLTEGRTYSVYNVANDRQKVELTNDHGCVCWYETNKYGIIQLIKLADKYVKYIGINTDEFRNGRIYQLCEYPREDKEYYYLMNDKNKFVGTRIINYMNGISVFEDVSLIINRNKALNKIGI